MYVYFIPKFCSNPLFKMNKVPFFPSGVMSVSAVIAGREINLNNDPQEKKIFRRTELPIYPSNEHSSKSKPSNVDENSPLFKIVKAVRIEGCKVMRTVRAVNDRCIQFVDTGIAHTQASYGTTLDYLREERNLLQRIGAIGAGSLTGYIFAIRRGYFKRILYMTTAGLATAAICYPEEAKIYSKIGLQDLRRRSVIGYHFLSGVTKDLAGFELPSYPLRFFNKDYENSIKQEDEKK